MSFVQRELDRIGDALRHSQPSNHYAELYAAQQALIWARTSYCVSEQGKTVWVKVQQHDGRDYLKTESALDGH
jgi:hypothetical protein